MDDNRHIWMRWIDHLHRWGLAPLAKSLLENLGGIGFIAAEFGYLFQPAFDSNRFQQSCSPLISLLEDEKSRIEFLQCLEEREKVMG